MFPYLILTHIYYSLTLYKELSSWLSLLYSINKLPPHDRCNKYRQKLIYLSDNMVTEMGTHVTF